MLTERVRRVVGCMTGTSLDGLDCALVEVTGDGLGMRARFIRGASSDLRALKQPLRVMAEQLPMTSDDIARAMREFSLLHAHSVRALLGGEPCDFVCVHGQTVFHQPPVSWQLFQPAPMVHALGVPVVFDLRQADLASGGQGAPITPIADWVLFHRAHDPMTIVNLGGFANYTQWRTDFASGKNHVPKGEISTPVIHGGDICACNQLLDRLARERLNAQYDEDGRVAASGVADPASVKALQSMLMHQLESGRSLGTGDELADWLSLTSSLSTPTVLKSACVAIGNTIATRVANTPVVIAGGGARNAGLVGALRESCGCSVATSDTLGVPVEFREAVCFAVLGALCQDRVPITLPLITRLPAGVEAPVAGVWASP